MPKEFETLFKELLGNGVSPIELSFWKEMIPVISEEERTKLKENFEKELRLRKEKKSQMAQ